ncbi:AzlC family ABC transporter permease [Natrinema sp. SYSU A 869]|uniref:AzlC family ABC transporter permease n=1 Tax=Natrinema sp. SYSU A 869 TaxID=2871694 RepID=UPI001CA41F1F|nr:AzlC family ABC transporter permease [Natrinema sp. SYSU A 869]
MSAEDADPAHRSEESEGPTVEFSLGGVRDGFIGCVPIALGVAGYGIVFGVLAHQAGLSVAEAAFMSATVLAGAAQLIAIELWETPIPILAVIGTTFIVNLRYVLMGAALRPWFSQLSPAKAYGSVFFTADENWALTMGKLKSGSHQGAYLLGSGLAIWSFWIIATVIGAIAGGVIGEPSQYGLDFILTAVFIAIAVGLWEGKSSLLPWIASFGIAVLSAQFLPGRWYILFGGVAGSLVEVIRFDG